MVHVILAHVNLDEKGFTVQISINIENRWVTDRKKGISNTLSTRMFHSPLCSETLHGTITG